MARVACRGEELQNCLIGCSSELAKPIMLKPDMCLMRWCRHGFSSGGSGSLPEKLPTPTIVSPRFSATLFCRLRNYSIFHKHLRKTKKREILVGSTPGCKKCRGQDTPDSPVSDAPGLVSRSTTLFGHARSSKITASYWYYIFSSLYYR